MAKNLIIAEKDNQAESIASALKMQSASFEVIIPTKESTKSEKRIKTLEKRIALKNTIMTKLIQEANVKGNDATATKKYQAHQAKLAEYESKLVTMKDELKVELAKLSRKSVPYWENADNVLIACSGHLIEIKQGKRKLSTKDSNEEEDEDEEEDDDDDAGSSEFESDEDVDLNFEIEYKAPSPQNDDSQPKWLKMKLIEYMLHNLDIKRIYCATDYDREGQSIFGTLMEFFKVDFNQCVRMKFSTLEEEVLQQAFLNPMPFDMNLFEAGKARRWCDFVIGFNLNPNFAKIYRHAIMKYLASLKIDQKIIDQVKYNNTFNMGRVKLVILKYIFDHTRDIISDASKVENSDVHVKEKMVYSFYFDDNDGYDTHLFTREDDDLGFLPKLKLDEPMQIKIDNITEVVDEFGLPVKHPETIPSFLNMTKVFDACEHLHISAEELNRILEYLYLQKYISYPRSKSERWEIDDDNSKLEYSRKVLLALRKCGYPIKDSYLDTWGNEGSETHSHPCIHPLPSVDSERVKRLQKLNPLAFLVFNQIAIETIKCFEKLPVVKIKNITYSMIQDGNEVFKLSARYILDIIEPNILDFEGYYDTDISRDIVVSEGDVFDIDVRKSLIKKETVSKNSTNIELLNDFDVLHFLNEEDIGTDATRAPLLTDLVEKQYLFSARTLLTTFLGNVMQRLAEDYVEFIDIDYTREIESYLNDIEKGDNSTSDFVEYIKDTVKKTYDDIMAHNAQIQEVFMDVPFCETHNTQMIIRAGAFGKYLICPFAFTDAKCNQRASM